MGCCGGGPAEDPESKKRNEEIEKQIKADKTRLRNEVKLLLLGTLSYFFILFSIFYVSILVP